MRIHFLCLLAVSTIIAMPAKANTLPGDSCTPAENNYVRLSAGPDVSGHAHLLFCNGSTWSSKMTWFKNGNIGVSYETPTADFIVMSTAVGSDRGIITAQINNADTASLMTIAKARGTPTALAPLLAGDYLGELIFAGYDGTGWDANSAKIQASAAVNFSSTDKSTMLRFITTIGAGANSRITIDGQGRVGIGTDTPQSGFHVPHGRYAQFSYNFPGAPPATDCDDDLERGRIALDSNNYRIYICAGLARGWDYINFID